MKNYYYFINTLILIGITFVLAHNEDGNAPELPITKELIEKNNQFKRNCNKRGSTCVLQNEVTQGPYYWNTELLRYNITEGQGGIPIILNITVVDTNSCATISNAAVDIWHANATGVYSHYNVNGNYGGNTTTFMRGMQLTNSEGLAQIATVLPGWYTGRTNHIHIKVHLNGTLINETSWETTTTAHTGQLFFNQSVLDAYAVVSPYSTNTQTRTALADDSIYAEAGDIAILELTYLGDSIADGVIATMILGVDSSASSNTGATPSSQSSGDSNSGSGSGSNNSTSMPSTNPGSGPNGSSSSSSLSNSSSVSSSSISSSTSTTSQSNESLASIIVPSLLGMILLMFSCL